MGTVISEQSNLPKLKLAHITTPLKAHCLWDKTPHVIEHKLISTTASVRELFRTVSSSVSGQ